MTQQPDSRPCTCALDERPYPCQRKYALGECRKAENRALRAELDRAIAQLADLTRQRLADEYAHGNVMGRIAIALFSDQNNRTDEECVAAVAELSYERSGAIQRAERAEADYARLRTLMDDAEAVMRRQRDERHALEAERDALAAAMPSEGADAAIGYAHMKAERDALRLEMQAACTSLCPHGLDIAAQKENAERKLREYEHMVMTGRNEQHERLVAERDALRKTLEDLLAANIDVWINSPEGRAYITSVTAMLKTSK